MSMIKVENLTFGYPSGYNTVFDNVSFQIDTDWKLGFVGRNGRGKTTFFNLLLGKYEYGGKIISFVRFDYFPHYISDKSRLTKEILAEIYPMAEEWEFMRELSCLKLDSDVLYRTFETLSYGEQTKVLLSALFLNEGNFPLIDEPTNHLDADARQIVSSYLQRKKGFILVSHDRAFLDGCVDHILSLNKANIEVQNGNFSSWMENFRRRQNYEQTRNDQLQKDIGRLRQASKRSAVWSDRVEASKIGATDKGYVGHKSAKMMKRAKAIDDRRQRAIEEKSKLLKNTETADTLKLSPLEYYNDTLVFFSNVAIRYDEKKICSDVSFYIRRGDRIALEGGNGSGKSSLLKLILGERISYTGTVKLGSGIVLFYVPQDTSFLKGKLSDFAKERQIDESLFKAILRKMGFERIQFENDIANFSDGQKKKVLIAKSLCEKAHLYIWDEPLNFINIYSRIQIEQLIKDFSPTMLFAEHDRVFRQKIATKIVKVQTRIE